MNQGVVFQFGVWFRVLFVEEGFWGFIWFLWLVGWFFFNPNLVHLLEVCTIPAGVATFSIVFVGLQT